MSTVAESSDSPAKRQRLEGHNGKHETSQGGQWVVDQTIRMKRHYCQALVSAALILQYKTACKKAGIPAKRIPSHLSHRMQAAWERYDLCRRRLEAFLRQNAAGATSPSRAIVLPTPQQPIPLPVPPRLQTDTAPLASPVPLSTASMFAFDPSKASAPPVNPAIPVSAATNIPPIDLTDLDASGFNLAELGGGMDGMDLSSLGMDELSAIINGSSFPFAGDNGTGLGIASLSVPVDGQAALTPRTQAANEAATESFLASLTTSGPNSAPASVAVTARGATSDAQTQAAGDSALSNQARGKTKGQDGAQGGADAADFSFDIPSGLEGDVDLNDLSELAGLFDTGGALGEMSRPVSATSTNAPTLQPPAEITTAALPSDPTGAAPNTSEAADVKPTTAPADAAKVTDPSQPVAVSEQASAPEADQQGDADGQLGEYDFSNIDLDDFNFGDSALMNVEGDEFQSLLNEFN